MILISVKSDFMDVKHQEETDKGAEKYLKTVKKLHDTHREHMVKKFVSLLPLTIGRFDMVNKRENYKKTCLPYKVEIINTDQNQLNFATQLK